jgi:acyl-CoA reductase-like NAD-dependent aldehyde dehydrogenase
MDVGIFLPKWNLYLQATQQVLSRLPLTTEAEFAAAVQSAREAFPKWRDTPIPTRLRVMFKLQQLIREHMVCCCKKTNHFSHCFS